MMRIVALAGFALLAGCGGRPTPIVAADAGTDTAPAGGDADSDAATADAAEIADASARGAAACRASAGCASHGECSYVAGACRAADDADCIASSGCRDLGNCALQKYYCAPGSDADCEKSPGCAEYGHCSHYHEGQCRAAEPAHCAKSKACTAAGRCLFNGKSCVCSVPPCSPGWSSVDCPGSSYCPCAGDGECDSGPCIETPAGFLCAEHIEVCMPGFFMGISAHVSGDPYYFCRPRWGLLCRPCLDNQSCTPWWLNPGASACAVDDDGAGFCLPSCDPKGGAPACPEGYACQDAVDVAGAVAPRCVPVDAAGVRTTCRCAPGWVEQALSTPCQRSNAVGTCKGERRCEVVGKPPSACDAPLAVTESCGGGQGDGVDDDCDGLTDEGCSP